MNLYAGYYQVGQEKFTNKLYAAIKASEQNLEMTWHFHDDLFTNIKPKGLNLKTLYKQRAQQLREKYDYLILYYSGGSDSWTVLNTFLENNIKLDHIFVKWPLSAMDKGFYKANEIDKTAYNFVSEWDLVLKNDLQWLAQNHPEIKIEIGDWLENLNTDYFNDNIFDSAVHHLFMTNLLRVPYGSKTEKQLVNKGVKVGSIYGVDKPAVVVHNNKLYYFFKDGAVSTCPIRPENPYGTEYFYWTPDMPNIVVEQAFQIYKWYKVNIDKIYVVLSTINAPEKKYWSDLEHSRNFQISADYVRAIVYPDWDLKKFQADKPIPVPEFDGKQKDYWIEIRPEFREIKPVWRHYWLSYITKVKNKFLQENKELKISRSKYHYVADL